VAARGPRVRTVLIERAAELDAIDRAVAGLLADTGSVVVVEASAGLGKTALLDRAAELAADAGCLVRHASPDPGDRHFAFGVIRTLLEAPLRDATEAERAELLAGAATLAGALLLDGTADCPDGEADCAAPIAHSVMWLCARLSGVRPLLLIVDDAQWSDRASLAVLTYLAGRIADLPLVIVAAARTGDTRAATDLLTLLGSARSATVLHPRPLSQMGAARLIRELAPGTPIHACADIHIAAAGNPWLIGELARAGSGRPVVRRRMAQLESRDRSVAAALAVLGDGAPRAISRVAAITLDELGPARDALTAAGLVTPDGEGIAHELIAAAIRDGLPAAEHERLHRESARALMALAAPTENVARHLLDTRPHGDPDVAYWLERAAGNSSPSDAVTYLERAHDELGAGESRGRVLSALAAAAFDAGLPDPRRHLRDALCEGRDPGARIDALTRLAAYGVFFGGDTADADLLSSELADPTGGAGMQVALLDALVAIPERHAEHARLATELTATDDPVLHRAVLGHRAWVATRLGTADAEMCAAMANAALDRGLLLREARQRGAFHLCVAVLIVTDRFEEARRAIAALDAEALANESMPMRAAAAASAAQLSLRTGRVAEAEMQARDALELAPDTAFATRAAELLAEALAERGAFEEAHELLDNVAGVTGARTRLALAEGDFDAAYGHACEAADKAGAALALAHLGRRDEAVRLAEAELAIAERFRAPVPIARALVARAVAEPDDEARIAICRRALASLKPGGDSVLESVRLRLELGSTLTRLGRRVEARGLLRPALADADAAGASLLADRARRELVASGLRPRRAALEGASALTPRQRQIVELAAAGTANRAIAQQLFLSIKTVETHLAAGYRKLGVRTRMDLTTAVAARPRA